MAHHALDNSGCKRLRISSLVCDMSAEQDKYVLFASGSDLVDELRSKGFHTNMWETMLTSAFNEVSAPVDALHTVIGLLRKKLDALQGGPAPAAPSPPAAPPANSAPAVNSVDPAASHPLSLAAPPPQEPAALSMPPFKRRRTSCTDGSRQHPPHQRKTLDPAFLPAFTQFALEYGQTQYKRLGSLTGVIDTAVFNAFKTERPEIPTPIQMHHYFNRGEWIQAVTTGNSSAFSARRQKTPVLTASTIEEKIVILPDLAPVCTWCAQWLIAAEPGDRRWRNLHHAHETARLRAVEEAASTKSLLSPEFTLPLDFRRTSAGLSLKLLLRFAAVPSARNQGLQGIVRSIC